jgi:hypothetical protein
MYFKFTHKDRIQKVLQISQSKGLSKCFNTSLKLPQVVVNVRLIWTLLQF